MGASEPLNPRRFLDRGASSSIMLVGSVPASNDTTFRWSLEQECHILPCPMGPTTPQDLAWCPRGVFLPYPVWLWGMNRRIRIILDTMGWVSQHGGPLLVMQGKPKYQLLGFKAQASKSSLDYSEQRNWLQLPVQKIRCSDSGNLSIQWIGIARKTLA